MMADLGGTGHCLVVKVTHTHIQMGIKHTCAYSLKLVIMALAVYLYVGAHVYVRPQLPAEVVLQDLKGLFYLQTSPETTPLVRPVSTLYLCPESLVSSSIHVQKHTQNRAHMPLQ